jgi:hypothetical protein
MMVTVQVSSNYRGNVYHTKAIGDFLQNRYNYFGGTLTITNGIHEGREPRGTILAYVYYFDFTVTWPNNRTSGILHFYLGSYNYQIDPNYDLTRLFDQGNEVNSSSISLDNLLTQN